MKSESMITDNVPVIWTIGHSTHTWAEFLSWLQSFGIKCLVDVRSLPGSRKFPQFDKENLAVALPKSGISYRLIKELGGRRKVLADSKNIAWKHPAFRGYADYMETVSFREGITELEKIARTQRTAVMCAEAVWWRCHRSMISDYLKVRGWQVFHIMGQHKETPHPFTKAAKVIHGRLHYDLPA